jgi:hypothetical protein
VKTTTYLRISLLIPFLVWASCALVFFLWDTFEPNSIGLDGSSAMAVIAVLILFYVFGIFVWFLPYVLLCLILLVWSFKSQTPVLMKVLALSPFAMAVLVLATVNLLSFNSGDISMRFSNPAALVENLIGANLLFLILALLWGYICVSIGYGVYKILQRLEFIRDGDRTIAMPLAEPL